MLQFEINSDTSPDMLRAMRAAITLLIGDGAKVQNIEIKVQADTQDAIESLDALKQASVKTFDEAPAAGAAVETAPDAVAVFTESSTPPAAAASAAPDTTTSANVNSAPISPGSVELDRDQLPWDGRIHSSSKGKIADGSWKKKRGVPDDVVASVQAELRAIMAAPAAVATVQAPPPAAAAPAQGQFPLPPAAAAPAAAPAADVAAAAAAVPVAPFPALMRKITAAQTAGKLAPADILGAAQSVGLTMLPDLMKRPDLLPQVEAYIDAMIQAAG